MVGGRKDDGLAAEPPEVTSGLDEGTDWEMMKLFRRMADGGMTIVCVTHTVANVEDFCHKIIVMANPGVLAFYGTPAEARRYLEWGYTFVAVGIDTNLLAKTADALAQSFKKE